MANSNLLDNHVQWLKENMSTHTLDNGVVELTLPFTDSVNDYIQIYITNNDDNSYTITDDGLTIFNLGLKDISIKNSKYRDSFNKICNNYGVELSSTDALKIRTDSATLHQSINRLLQAIIVISNISMY